MGPTIVDIHCHTFNADDVPLHGFIQRVGLHDSVLDNVWGDLLGRLAQILLQGGAPGYDEERALLDSRLAPDEYMPSRRLAFEAVAEKDETAEVNRALREVEVRDPTLLPALEYEFRTAEGKPLPDARELLGSKHFFAARRAVAFVLLLGKLRVELTQRLIKTFGDQVDLFCPLTVAFGGTLEGVSTDLRQQVELQEKISRLSMQGTLPGGGKARIHPFIGFDPVRAAEDRAAQTQDDHLEIVKRAVRNAGFVGVKVYPPMGWVPIGNKNEPRLQQKWQLGFLELLDDVLLDLYRWCVKEQVPITAHCNRSNYVDDDYADFASPERWISVLRQKRFRNLRLNLGHFGGMADKDDVPSAWGAALADAVSEFPNLYVDVSNHRIDSKVMGPYTDWLGEILSPSGSPMRKRIMYGSDWYMKALHPKYRDFLDSYRATFSAFPSAVQAGFLGGNALSFLGFDDASNKNARRLHKRYLRYAPDRVPVWLKTAS